MRHRLALLGTATSLVLAAGVAAAGAAAAASPTSMPDAALGAASGTSVLFYCPNAPEGNVHPGLHTGWASQPSGERRNVGGTCPGPEPG
jgi:hypothetical protein